MSAVGAPPPFDLPQRASLWWRQRPGEGRREVAPGLNCDIGFIETEPRPREWEPYLVYSLLGAEQQTIPWHVWIPRRQLSEVLNFPLLSDDLEYPRWQRRSWFGVHSHRVHIGRPGYYGGPIPITVGDAADDTVGPLRCPGLPRDHRRSLQTQPGEGLAHAPTRRHELRAAFRDRPRQVIDLLLVQGFGATVITALTHFDARREQRPETYLFSDWHRIS